MRLLKLLIPALLVLIISVSGYSADVTLDKRIIVTKILVMENNVVKVSTVTRYRKKAGDQQRVAEIKDYHLLRPAMGGNPQDDISGETARVQAVCNAIW